MNTNGKRAILPGIIANRKGEWVELRLNELDSSTYTARAHAGRAQEGCDILLDHITLGRMIPLFVCNQHNQLLGGHRSKWAYELGGFGDVPVEVYRIETSGTVEDLRLTYRLNEEQSTMGYSKEDIDKQLRDLIEGGCTKKEALLVYAGSPLEKAAKRGLHRMQVNDVLSNRKNAAAKEALERGLEGKKLLAFLKAHGFNSGQITDIRRKMHPDLRHDYSRRFDGWGDRVRSSLHKSLDKMVVDRNAGRLTIADIRVIMELLRKEIGQMYQTINEQEVRLKAPVLRAARQE